MNITDEILWRSLRDGDEQAFSALFERYYSLLVNYGQSLTSQGVTANDCVQDVFADIWIYRKSLSEITSIKAYLLSCVRKRIARQYQRDHIFTRATSLADVEFTMTFTVQDQMIRDEETRANVSQLNQRVNALPSRQKEALYLRYLHDVPIEMIAEMMQINYQSVVNLIYKAIQQLRKSWEGELPFLFLIFITFLK